ncbi:MAG: PE-PPE domain-containing protein [Chloroflexota bacterium]
MLRRPLVLSAVGAIAGAAGFRSHPVAATLSDTAAWLHVVAQGPYNVRRTGSGVRRAQFRLTITCDRCRNRPSSDTTVNISSEYDPVTDFPVAPLNILAEVNGLSGMAYLFVDAAVNATITYIRPNGKFIRAWTGKTR